MNLMLLFAILGAAPAFTYVDLAPAANVNPLSEEEMKVEGVNVPETSYVWLEGERYNASNRDFPAESALAASEGLTLGGGFGSLGGDWVEWHFDLPFESANAMLFVRTARIGENAFTALDVTLNGEAKGTVLVPPNTGWGQDPSDFQRGLCSVPLGDVAMGRQVLHIGAGNTAEAIHIDGMWISDGKLDIVNRLGPDGAIRKPASIYELVYRPGGRSCDDVWFDLPDPGDGKSPVILRLEGEAVTLPVPAVEASQVAVLGAGVKGAIRVPLELRYRDGSTVDAEAELGPLYSKSGENAAMTLGQYRFAYVDRVDLEERGLESVTFKPSTGSGVILGITLIAPTL